MVTPGYYRVFGVQLVRGRLVDDKIDTPTSAQVVVVNERFVERFIPKRTDHIGQALAGKDKVTIVGVVRNVRQNIYDRSLAEMDFPISQIAVELRANYLESMHLVVRTAVAPKSITQDLRRIFGDLDKTLPFRTPETMDAVFAGALNVERLENWLFGSFASLALVLALVGLYGLISHEVELSCRDLGIRLAVGAPRSSIFALIYQRVAVMLAIGLIAGMAATWAIRGVLASVVSLKLDRDSAALLGITGIFLGIALLAALIPARRAATVDPMTSLRLE
ncbi:MAG TPA: FtsX-like permease family protein [Bryobacteraceae bacterium]|nr:FtsX-like permease family protein [Bryobacteraceae bacterium]